MSPSVRKGKVVAYAMLVGLLAASSSTGHFPSKAAAEAPTSRVTSSKLDARLTGRGRSALEQLVPLTDGRSLVVSRDGKLISIRNASNKVVRRFSITPERISSSATMLASGKVLVWGGTDARGQVQEGGLIFDSAAQSLVPFGQTSISSRAGHTATLLTDGSVLFAGGVGADNTAELWNETTDVVTPLRLGQVSFDSNHQAALQRDGSVRLIGVNSTSQRGNGSLAFDPATNSLRPASDTTEGNVGLAESVPANGAKEVPPGSPLALRFTHQIRVRDLSAHRITLLGPGGAARINVVGAEGGRLAFIHPSRPLFPSSSYSLLIDGLQTVGGEPAPLIAIDFRTASLPAEIVSEPSALARGSHRRPISGACVGIQMCRGEATLQEGAWRPGKNSIGGRWRVLGSQPKQVNPQIMAVITEAMAFTTVIGQVKRVDDQPVSNVTVSIGAKRALTDADGRFFLYEVPSGKQEIFVDGSTANRSGIEYGQFVVGLDIARGKLTQLPYTMYLPRISERDKIRIDSPTLRETVITHPDMPGLMVQIPKDTVIRDRSGKIVRELAIVPTPVNRAPFPVADNFPMYFTLEPGGAVIQGLTPEAAKGVRLFYPNYDDYPSGTQANFWIYEPAEGWRVYGKGRVTTNGRVFSPESGVALHQTMGGSYSVDANDPAPEEDKPECSEGCGSAQTGGGATAGDPIDLRTGTFFYDETDITISDIVPIRIGRSYRPRDTMKRSFGIGTASSYSYKLSAEPSNGFNTMSLVPPNGARIKFERASGTGLSGSWRQNGSVTSFNNAEIRLESGRGYVLYLNDGSQMLFDKYSPNQLLSTSDRYGNRTEFVYDAGLMTRIISPSGRFVNLEYDASNRIESVEDMLGNTWRYEYEGTYGLLSKVVYPDLTFKQYVYRARKITSPESVCPSHDSTYCSYRDMHISLGRTVTQHAIASITDRRGVKVLENKFELIPGATSYIGRIIEQELPGGASYTIDYSHSEPLSGTGSGVLVTNPDGSKRRLTFEPGSRYPQTDTVGYGTPLAQTVTFERGDYGQITARTDALGRRTEFGHNGYGKTTSVRYLANTPHEAGISLSYIDDRLTSVIDPLNRTTSFEYGPDGHCLTALTSPLGKRTEFTCNLAGRPTSVTDSLGRTTRLHYLDYELAEVVDPLGRRIQYRYDVLGRLVAVEDDTRSLSYRAYDAEGRVVKVTSPTGKVTEISYDPNGNVTAVLMPNGNGITYEYDEQGRLESRTDALSQTESWTYDEMGRVVTYTDRKQQVTSFTYDALGRLKTTVYEDGGSVTATYDAGNRLRALVDSVSGTISWDYDGLDRLIGETSPQGSLSYELDLVGRRTQMIAGSQAAITYGYDDGDRLRTIQQGSELVEFSYDDADRPSGMTLPNGIMAGYAYNHADQLTGIAWRKPDNTPLADLGYGYNAIGQRVAQSGSLASELLPLASNNVFDDNNRQTSYNGQALSYDANGNLTNDGGRTYVWNAREQLAEIRQGGNVVASFSYDAMGRRTGRSEGGTSTAYLYDGIDAVQQTVGGVARPILTGLSVDQRYAQGVGANRQYFLTDDQGTTRLLTDGSGMVVQRYDYDPYGRTEATTGAQNSYRYTGREQDESGLYYYRARYYHAGMGRFISEDPLGLAAGDLNFYAYVHGDPLSYTDPTGEFACGVAFAAADLAWQLYQNGGNLSCVDWGQVGLSLLGGGLLNGLLKGAFRFKTAGSHTWDATRKWMNRRGIQTLSAGQQRHHWLLQQNQGWFTGAPNWLRNQPWNTNPISSKFNNWLGHRPNLAPLGGPSWAAEIPAGGVGSILGADGRNGCDCQ